MKQIFFITILLILAFNSKAQDTLAKQKLKINEIAIIGTAPIIPLYNYSSNRDIIFSVLKDDHVLSTLISAGYTDTSKATKMLRPLHYLGPLAGNVGLRCFINLPNNSKSKLRKYIPITFLIESGDYANYIIGKKEVKRIDTVFNAGETIYLDSVSTRATRYRLETQSIYLQSGLNIESGNQYFRFSTGLNIGLGISLRNKLYIEHSEYSFIMPTSQNEDYYESIYGYSEDKIQKVKPILNARFLLPFCMKVNFKKVKHIGIMGEISPGFEMNKVVKGDLLTRWMLFCSLGARYTF